MIRTLCGLSALLLSTTLPGLAEARQDQAPVPVEHYARSAEMSNVSISPNGEEIAFLSSRDGSAYAVIRSLATGENRVLDLGSMRALGTQWVSDDRLLISVGDAEAITYIEGNVDFSILLSVDADSLEWRRLVRNDREIGFNPSAGSILAIEPDGRVLMQLRDREGALNLYSLDPESRGRRLRMRGSEHTQYWIADPSTDRYARFSYFPDNELSVVSINEDGRWRTVLEDTQVLAEYTLEGFSSDGEALLVSTGAQGGQESSTPTRSLVPLSLTDGSLGDPVFSDPHYDMGGVSVREHNGTVAGVSIDRDITEIVWFDEGLADTQASLQAAFGDEYTVYLSSWTPDRSRFVIRAIPQDRPALYFLFDTEAQEASFLGASMPELHNAPTFARRKIEYPARDGVMIPAYLTLPEGDGPHPFVMLPHGGPAARDVGGFDYFAHFLASRGYGVLQPNFRGSDGYGAEWEALGWGEWGTGLMQHDVTDGVTYLREQGLAERLCIAGGSYGGYAALAGATFTPDLYDCAISFNGVADLSDMLEYSRDRGGRDSQAVRYWRLSMTGDFAPDQLQAELAARSPERFVDQIEIPVLLIHAEGDTVVTVQQSQAMDLAMRRAGKDVRYVELEGGDHWLLEPHNRARVLQEMETFLGQHLND